MHRELHEPHAAREARLSSIARVAAVGDIHVTVDAGDRVKRELGEVKDCADVLLLAGDLTQHGTRVEAEVLARELETIRIPILAVLGNHDYHADEAPVIRDILEQAGVRVLEAENCELDVGGLRIGVAGIKGFGSGFPGACATEFGEPEMKAFVRHARETAARMRECLLALKSDIKIALTHYAPVKDTLMGERPELYPFLGSYWLAESIDESNCQLAVHGHAHRGTEWGVTPGGIPVRNVARPVIRCAFKVYQIGPPCTRMAQAQ
jgi:Icc-related predicted phosphoesterase